MTLNELCTNTTKFGALSVPAGRIEIVWKIEEADAALASDVVREERSDGPAPSRQSFGTRLIGSLGSN